MRFVRNVALKEHLNAHFEANLALKRRGDRTMARDQYQGFSEFVAPRKHVIKQDGKSNRRRLDEPSRLNHAISLPSYEACFNHDQHVS